MDDRAEVVKAAWKRVNEIADTSEDTRLIRSVITEAGVEPGVHVGTAPDDFTETMVGEWVLGQWADMIDANSPFLNSARNISFHQWDLLYPVG